MDRHVGKLTLDLGGSPVSAAQDRGAGGGAATLKEHSNSGDLRFMREEVSGLAGAGAADVGAAPAAASATALRLGDVDFATWKVEMRRLLDEALLLRRGPAEIVVPAISPCESAGGVCNATPTGQNAASLGGAGGLGDMFNHPFAVPTGASPSPCGASVIGGPVGASASAVVESGCMRKPFRTWTAQRAAARYDRVRSTISLASGQSNATSGMMQSAHGQGAQTAVEIMKDGNLMMSSETSDLTVRTTHTGQRETPHFAKSTKASKDSLGMINDVSNSSVHVNQGDRTHCPPALVVDEASESDAGKPDCDQFYSPMPMGAGEGTKKPGGEKAAFKRMNRNMRTQRLKGQLSERFRKSSYLRLFAATLVLHPNFDGCVCCMILLNAISMGIQADYTLQNSGEPVPLACVVAEKIFACLFTLELLLRFSVFGCSFWTMTGRHWNIFDFVVVSLQLVEEMMSLFSLQNFSLIGMLRLLRLVRVIRLARILRLIRELRVLVTSITHSMKSLIWTVMLMFLMIYAVGLCITQILSDHVVTSSMGSVAEISPDIDTYFGSLLRCMLSLFEAITGGTDWDVLVSPLMHEVSPGLAVLFVVYISIAMLAIMNVVTGVFVDSVLASAKSDKEQFLLNNARSIFTSLDQEMDWDTFSSRMSDPEMLEFFKGIDVDPSEAQGIFSLIDVDDSGSINADEFLNSCVRLQGPSKALETAVLLQELKHVRKALTALEISALIPPISP